MADKMVFPIGFDLESGVKEAEKQAESMLERIKKAISGTPIKITPIVDREGAGESIKAIDDELKKLSKTWNEMPFEDKFKKKGGLSDAAQELITEYKQLSAAQEIYGKTLKEIIGLEEKSVAEAEKLAEAERKRIRNIKGIGIGYDTGGMEEQVKKYDKIIARLKEIDSLIAFLKAKGEVRGLGEEQSEKVVKLLDERIELEKQLKDITVTGSDLAKQKLKEEAEEQKRNLEIEEKRKKTKGIGVGLEEGKPNKGLENSLKELEEIDKRLKEIDATYARLNATGAATKADGSASERVIGLLRERNGLEERKAELQRTASEASKKLAKEEAAAQKQLLALEKQRAKEEEAANRKRQKMLNARYAARAQEKQALAASIADLRQQRAALSAQENTIAKINAKLAVYNKMLQTAAIGSEKFNRITANINRLSAMLSDVSGESKKVKAVKAVTNEYARQTTYIERLIKRMLVYGSFRMVGNFLKQVREVTAQFELQRISLGAIIQDQTRANALFSEIKQFALKSPVSIMDFTKYTKQVAAYGIETEKLFDTTKRLADVSVGLGVSLERLALFYGQVYATGYLRASEVRQATEAGIPLVAKLSEKLSAANGELVTAADVMDMISKRAISFDMVAEVFQDMTDKGGMFYNMQEKQGNTLYGMWAKLGDAASMMYDEIGNTWGVRKGMEGVIKLVTRLMKDWRSLARVALVSGAAMGVMKLWFNKLKVDQELLTAATDKYTKAASRKAAADARGTKWMKLNAYMAEKSALMNKKAAAATTLWEKSINKLGAALAGNWLKAALALIGLIINKIVNAVQKARELKKALKEIENENWTEQEKSLRNFKSLAKIAVESADGSKKQRDALEELRRTYGEIIPVEKLSIDNLRKMKGEYGELTKSIRQNIQEQMKQKAADTVIEKYGKKILDNERKVTDYLEKMGLSYERARAFLEEYKKAVEGGSTDMKKNTIDAFKAIGIELEKETDDFQNSAKKLYSAYSGGGDIHTIHKAKVKKLTKAYRDLDNELKKLETRKPLNNAGDTLGKYRKYVEELTKTVQNATYRLTSGEAVDLNTYFGKQMQNNLTIKKMGEQLKEALGDAWDDAFATVVERVNEGQANVISSLDFTKIIEAAKAKNDPDLENLVKDYQERYSGIVPSDSVTRTLRDKLYELSKTVKGGMGKMQKFTLKEGADLKEHLKFVTDYYDELQAKIYKYSQQAKLLGVLPSAFGVDDMEKEAEAVKKYAEAVKYYLQEEEKSDPRLQTLKEIADKMAQINKEYREQLKYQDEQSAFATTQRLFAKSFEEMQAVAKKYKFQLPTFETPRTAADVEKWYRAIMGEIKRLNLKDAAKVLIELGFNADKVNIDEIQRNIEADLSRMAENISKSKAVKGFFDKIFADTKDYNLAMDVTVGVYGDAGNELKRQIAEQIRYATSKHKGSVFVDLDMGGIIDPKTLDVNYKALRDAIKKYEDTGGKIPEEQKKVLDQILKNGEEYNRAQIEEWNKVLNKNRDFAQRYVDLWREVNDRTREVRAAVASGTISKETGDKYIQGYQRERKEGEAKLEWEMFKDMPMYVQMFDDLDKASGKALTNMRAKLSAMQSAWKDLSPTELKELQSRLNEIDSRLATKNPFRLLSDSIKEYKDARASLNVDTADLRVRNAKADVANAEKDYGADSYEASVARETLAVEEKRLDVVKKVSERKKGVWGYERLIAEAIKESVVQQEAARANLEAAQAEYERMQQELEAADQTDPMAVEAARNRLLQQELVLQAAQEMYTIERNTTKEFQKQADAGKKLKSNIDNVVAIAGKWASDADNLAGTLGDIKDLLQISSDSTEGIVLDSAVEGLQNFSKIMGVIIGLQTIYNAICDSNPWFAIAAAVLAVASVIKSLVQNANIAKQNAEIEKQDKIIKRLEREYDRLADMQDKVFGAEYIANYTKRMSNLESQYAATMAKIEAERAKGKKADKDKIEELEDDAYETMKKIEEMEHEVSERMLGTDLASAAVSFAEAWLDAYLSFSDTAEAMKDKYKEMMRNFIVQSVLAKYVQASLAPLYKMIEDFSKGGFTNDEIKKIAEYGKELYKGIDGGLTTLVENLKDIIDFDELYDTGELTGISRDIATASEESINGLAVGINTQNFYISRIHANMNLLMENLSTGALKFTLADATMEALEKHLSYLPTIAQHTAETVDRCERAAVACESTLELLGKAIKPEGVSAPYRMHVA